jgi:hypothetical protein
MATLLPEGETMTGAALAKMKSAWVGVASAAVAAALSIYASDAVGQTRTWSDVDCSKSEIVMPGYSKCRMETAVAGEEGRGEFQSQTATYRAGDEFILVFLQKPRITLAGAAIKVTPEARETFLSQPAAEVAKKGTNFSPTTHVTGGYVKTFSLPSDWKCFSFVKDAPYRGDGIAYFMAGYRCTKGSSQPESAMTAFLQKLGVK